MKLSVVLPTLHRIETARTLAGRFLELFPQLETEVIIVTQRSLDTTGSPGIRVVADRGDGVYAAYATGLSEARGEYVWLIGDDDYPLDAVAALAPTLATGEADLIVAPVIFSSGKVYRPYRSKLLLLFFNWCQQGVIYRTAALKRYRFYRRLRIQADHFVNVLMRADPALRTVFSETPICLFGVHGLSSRSGDLKFRALRPLLARRTLGCFGYLIFEGIVRAMAIRKWRAGTRT